MALFSDYVCVVSKSTAPFPATQPRAGPCSTEAAKRGGMPQQDGCPRPWAAPGQEGRLEASRAGWSTEPALGCSRKVSMDPAGGTVRGA